MTTKISFPQLKVRLEQHTVEVGEGRFLAGFLVRCTASGKDLGRVWSAGSAWRWRTPNNANHGERSSQFAAVQVLRDAADLGAPTRPARIVETDRDAEVMAAWRASTHASRPTPKRSEPPDPPQPRQQPRQVVWDDAGDDAPDLSATIAAAFRKHGGR